MEICSVEIRKVKYTTDYGNLVEKIASTGCDGVGGDSGHPRLYDLDTPYHFTTIAIAGRELGKKDCPPGGERRPVSEPDPAGHPCHSGKHPIRAQCLSNL